MKDQAIALDPFARRGHSAQRISDQSGYGGGVSEIV
jgi:hypothetical protein